MTLSIITISIATLSIMTFRIMTISIASPGMTIKMTLIMTTVSV